MPTRKTRRVCRYCLYFKPEKGWAYGRPCYYKDKLPTCEVDVVQQLVDRPRPFTLVGMTDRRCQDFWPADLPRAPLIPTTEVQS